MASSDRRDGDERGCECKHCQLDCALAASTELPVLVDGPSPVVLTIEPEFHQSVFAFRLERPKWRAAV